MTLEIEIKKQLFLLHNSGAIYWVSKRILLLSDVHLGKISHFRKHGAALPAHAIFRNFDKLDAVIACFNPEKICFLGDLFHSELNTEWLLFSNWVGQTNLPMILIAGNHDVIHPENYFRLDIVVVKEWIVDDFLLTHHPEERDGFFSFSGHIHPSVLLAGKGRQFLKLPCFFKTESQMILPAFGEFTGTYVMQPTENDMVYVLTKEEIIKIENHHLLK